MTHVMEGETTRKRNDSGRNDSGRTRKWAKRPVTVWISRLKAASRKPSIIGQKWVVVFIVSVLSLNRTTVTIVSNVQQKQNTTTQKLMIEHQKCKTYNVSKIISNFSLFSRFPLNQKDSHGERMCTLYWYSANRLTDRTQNDLKSVEGP